MYTALDQMRIKNLSRYGIDGPVVPDIISYVRKNNSSNKKEMTFTEISQLETHAIHFVRERCEELRFDKQRMDLEDLDGTSLKKGQIPFNMEKDLDRLCLEAAIHRFLESGVAEDAFDIYYIYLEMFMGEYSTSKKMIERLSEFESNASSLLTKHRDHYSHSVYVFLIGLAIYDSSASYREKYNDIYHVDGKEGAHHFLKYWGLSSLFHDIGYAFELPFEEIKSYFAKDQTSVPYVCYRDMDKFIQLDEANKKKALRLTGGREPQTMSEVLVWRIDELLGEHYKERPRMESIPMASECEDYAQYLDKVFCWKPADPNKFGGYMDHAYFSAMLLMDNLFDILDEEELNPAYADCLSAIALHNSIFAHVLQAKKLAGFDPDKFAIQADWHPLAYLLMLCDELQCWDRTSYGQTSRTEVHAMACDLTFDGDSIGAKYKFDKAMEAKANRKNSDGKLAVGGTYKKMIQQVNGVTKFQHDIEEIVALNRDGELSLNVTYEFTADIKYRKTYLSHSNFMHLYDFAIILSGRKKHDIKDADLDQEMRAQMAAEFEAKSLEYKMIDIERVKKFAKYLDAIDCFYTDRAVAYPPLDHFKDEDMDVIGPLEHERWLWVHHVMGWKYDEKYTTFDKEEQGRIREMTRTHKLMLKNGPYLHDNMIKHYHDLPGEEQEKDTEPMNKLLGLLSMLDGVKFYRLSQEKDDTV